MPLILSTQAGKEVIRYNNRGINFTLRFSSLWANSSRPAPTRFKLSGKNKGAKAALKSGTFLPRRFRDPKVASMQGVGWGKSTTSQLAKTSRKLPKAKSKDKTVLG
jgi:hypothetical protein